MTDEKDYIQDVDEKYKVDSTRGNSMINPLNYKGDVLVQVWVDSRVLATLYKWLDNQGVYVRYMSQVVRRPLEVLASFLVDNDEVEMVDDTTEARNILHKKFGIDLNRGGRGLKNAMHNTVLSARRGELGERVKSKTFDADVPRFDEPIHDGPEGFDMEKALEIFEGEED